MEQTAGNSVHNHHSRTLSLCLQRAEDKLERAAASLCDGVVEYITVQSPKQITCIRGHFALGNTPVRQIVGISTIFSTACEEEQTIFTFTTASLSRITFVNQNSLVTITA